MNFSFFLTILCLGFSGVSIARATTFYISPTGHDSRSGTSPENAWKTAARVNRVGLSAGDSVLFEGGKTFKGPVKFSLYDRGTAEDPIVVGSYRLE